MKAKFNAYEEQFDLSFLKEICEEHGERITFRRGEFFAHSNCRCRRIGWIVSGAFKHTLTDRKGNVKTVGFAFSNSVVGNYLGAVAGQKLPTDIVALKDSEVQVAQASPLIERLEADPALHVRFVQALFAQCYDTLLSVYALTPEERYRELVARAPELLSHVTLAELSSYLNISLRQLHRFRNFRR